MQGLAGPRSGEVVGQAEIDEVNQSATTVNVIRKVCAAMKKLMYYA